MIGGRFGPYEVIAKVGEGGMGEVYCARDAHLNREVALKVLLWAFGCVLYEMLTARRAFKGDDVSETLATVLKSDPDWRALPGATPEPIHRLLRRCLAKDPKERIGDASTARLEIDSAISVAKGHDELNARAPRKYVWQRASVGWSAAAVFLLAAAVLGWLAFARPAGDEGPVTHAVIPSPDNAVIGAPAFLYAAQGLSIGLSPDGRHLLFIASGSSGPWRLWVRPLDGDSARPLAGTENATRPFRSADSRSVAFFADGVVLQTPFNETRAQFSPDGRWIAYQ